MAMYRLRLGGTKHELKESIARKLIFCRFTHKAIPPVTKSKQEATGVGWKMESRKSQEKKRMGM
jgi:hypothetical protein